MRYLFLIIIFLWTHSTLCVAQSCDLENEDFTGTSTNNPPPDWITDGGSHIGPTVPPDPIQDPALGLNRTNEYVISDEYTCVSQVCFDWHASSAGSNYDVVVSWSQDTTNWQPLHMITTTGSSSPVIYQTICLDFPLDSLMSPFNVRIRWQMTRRSGGTFYLENNCISSGISCNSEPSELRFFYSQTDCREVGTPFNLQVCATDASGHVSDSFNGIIHIIKQTGPGELVSPPSYLATNGCATISNAIINMAGDYTFMATADSLSGNSDSISIVENCPSELDIKVMSYNLLNFPNGRNDCGSNTTVPARWDTLQKIVQYCIPDVLMVCELQNTFGADMILSHALNSNGTNQFAAANFIPNQSNNNTGLNNMLYYNQNKLTLYEQSQILTTTRDFNKYTLFVNDANLSTTLDTVFIDFYVTHLKAGSSSSDSLRRLTDCAFLRAHLDSLPPRNFILGGDLNLYTSTEQAYQLLLTGNYPLVDPAQMEGPWNNNYIYRQVHSQSTREPGAPNYDCGAGGGSDSRFDFLLISESIQEDSMHVSYVNNTYRSLGNNGSIYNKAINDPSNTDTVPFSILNAMYYMSDHMPVVMELHVVLPEPSCNDHLSISSSPLAGGLYKANHSILSNGLIQAPSFVSFRAGDSILLTNQFEVELGAIFMAEIGPCD